MISYRKLPGRKRGIFHAASLWVQEDHLLSVKADRFHEYYRRFFFRDIQALVVTREPRYTLSTPALGLFLLLVGGAGFVQWQFPELGLYGWTLVLAAAGVWLWMALTQSCTLRLYTAVSREDLPSVYRVWTANKLLGVLEPLIEQQQGRVPEGWAENVQSASEAISAPPKVDSRAVRGLGRSRTLVSDLFLCSLFADGALTLWQTAYRGYVPTYVTNSLALIEVLLAILIVMQRHRRILRPAMQRIAIAAMVLMGGEVYTQSMVTAFLNVRAGKVDQQTTVGQHPQTFLRQIYIGGCFALALTGVVVSFAGAASIRQPEALE